MKAKGAKLGRHLTPEMKASDLWRLVTEKPNSASIDLDRKSSLEIARIINVEDSKVAGAVARAFPQIAQAIDWIAAALSSGGRLIYVGTGTSGRIAALDAAECPPTFNTNRKMVQFIMAGGSKALAEATEASEDSRVLGRREMAKKRPCSNDVIVGIAASGRTPFTVAAIKYAHAHRAKTVAVVCNRNSPLERAAHIAIVAEVGPEVVTGSTRMKAGTAQKMILNTLTTGAMARLGYVYGNLMVNLHLKNEKLAARGVSILQKTTKLSPAKSSKLLKAAHHSVPVGLVMAMAGVSRMTAVDALILSRGHVREAIQVARSL
jgi:N-acetylmuramic acid 6-phosphate etherase